MNPYYENTPDDMRAFVSDNCSFPAHFHPDLELLAVLSGSVEAEIGGRKASLGAGDFAMVFPHQLHQYRCALEDGTKVAFIIAKPWCFGEYVHALLGGRPAEPVWRADALPPDISWAVGRLLDPDARQNRALGRALLQIVLAHICTEYPLQEDGDAGFADMTCRAVDYVQQHYDEPLLLEDVARALGISRYALSRLFNGRLGVRFTSYLNELRIHKAQNLLQGSTIPIGDVAQRCGFENARTFNRAFLACCGKPPREYRALYKTAGK